MSASERLRGARTRGQAGAAVVATDRVRQVALRVAPFLGAVTRVETDQPIMALTFDDGPDPVATPALLDVLKGAGHQATFFAVGERAGRYPDLLARIVDEGHALANHSFDHRSFLLTPVGSRLRIGRWRRAEVRAAADVLGARAVPLFRPPYGHQDLACRFDAFLARHRTIGWNLTAGDFLGDSGEEIARRTAERIEPGDIVTFHDGLADAYDPQFLDRSPTVDAVERLLELVGGRLQSVTVPQLLAAGTPRYRFRYPPPVPLHGLRRSAAEGG